MRADVAYTDRIPRRVHVASPFAAILGAISPPIASSIPPLSTTTLVAVALAVAPTGAAVAEVIEVKLDQAVVRKINPRTVTLVVGNPLIADVSVQAGGVMVVTGKGYGLTNLIALDREGNVLAREIVEVASPVDVVVVYRGVARESYSCTPYCNRRITLGDAPEYFETTLGETGDRNRTAQTGQGNGAVR